MKRCFLFFLTLIVFCLLSAHPREFANRSFTDGSRWGFPARADSLHGFNVQSYDLHLYIDDANEYLEGMVEAVVIAEESLSTIEYEFVGMQVDSVKVNDEIAEFSYNNELIEIALNVSENDSFTTKVFYSGNPILHTNYFTLGMIFQTNYVFTVSDPNATRYWMPCYDHPWDKAELDLHIRMRDDWLVACNGIRTEIEDLEDGTKIHHWDGQNPMATYLFSISAGDFVEFESIHNGVPLHNFAPQDLAVTAESDYEELPQVLDIYENAFGSYPFEKYGNSITNFSTYGAMEHQTMTTLDRSYIGTQYGRDVIAHEFAHQWFGDCLTPLTWKDVWLSESFATYSEALYRCGIFGYENMVEYIRTSHHNYYLSWMSSNGPRTVYDPIYTETFSPPVYEKGASVLHMLRLKVGDEAFFSILQTYFTQYQNSNVITDEFIQVAETVSEQSLTQFFDQWIFNPGVPSLDYAIFTNELTNEVMFSFLTTSNTDTEFYLDIPIKISTEMDSVLVTATPNSAEETIISVDDFSDLDFEVDPNEWLLVLNKSEYQPELDYAYAADGLVALFWSTEETNHNVEGYHVYRSDSENGEYTKISNEIITGTYFEDVAVENEHSYYYCLKGVTQTSFESKMSDPIQASPISFPLNNGVLVIDSSNGGNGSLIQPSNEQFADFYQNVTPSNVEYYSIEESGDPTIEYLADFSTIIWHDDDLSFHSMDNIVAVMGPYLLGGGKVIFSGWKSVTFIPESFRKSILNIETILNANDAEFVGATSNTYTTLTIDETKIMDAWNNALPYVSVFPENDGIYQYQSQATSEYDDQNCALSLEVGTEGKLILFGFPLYFMEENSVQTMLTSLLNEFGEVSNDQDEVVVTPVSNIISKVYPNPFQFKGNREKGEISISFEIKEPQNITLQIFNIMGQKIHEDKEKYYQSGNHIKHWNGVGSNGKLISSGVYFTKIKGKDSISVKKFVIID